KPPRPLREYQQARRMKSGVGLSGQDMKLRSPRTGLGGSSISMPTQEIATRPLEAVLRSERVRATTSFAWHGIIASAIDLRLAKANRPRSSAGPFLLMRQGSRSVYAAPRSSPPFGAGMATPSPAYSLSLFLSVRIETPRIFAAWVRLPRQCLS